ncbi:MAG: hypothetical protein WKF47_06245 [Geodermatophilaceae bacterium]
MENLLTNVKEWEAKALDLSQRLAQFNRIKGKVDRLKSLYDRLTNSLKEVGVSQVVDSGDQVAIMEMATIPQSVRPGLIKSLLIGLGCGAAAGIVILLLLDRIDDRMASFGEFQNHFSENVLGQIPKEKTKGKVSLLQPDDARHVFAESYRNIRSSIFFMPYEGPRPKTLLVTSAVPNEGKSTISANLAITFALSGARTLLIDGDLRRGAQREAFDISSRIGFAEVLKQEVNWQDVVVPTSYPKPLRNASRQDPLAAERAPAPGINRCASARDLQSLRLHHHRQLARACSRRHHKSGPEDRRDFVCRPPLLHVSAPHPEIAGAALQPAGQRARCDPELRRYSPLPEYYYYQYAEYYNTPLPGDAREGEPAALQNGKHSQS